MYTLSRRNWLAIQNDASIRESTALRSILTPFQVYSLYSFLHKILASLSSAIIYFSSIFFPPHCIRSFLLFHEIYPSPSLPCFSKLISLMLQVEALPREIDQLWELTKEIEGHTICSLGD